MTCPMCGSDTKVTYTYDKEDHVVRDRKCVSCRYRFQTIEVDEDFSRCSEDATKLSKLVAEVKQIAKKLSDLGDCYD